jgi:hypothetical protein
MDERLCRWCGQRKVKTADGYCVPCQIYVDEQYPRDGEDEIGEDKMAFDGRCYELAKAALADEERLNREDMRCLLAQHIQTTIEKWITLERDIAAGQPHMQLSRGR